MPYRDDYWGISASDSATGYQAWGGPPKIGGVDGSVVPCATAGSLSFLPDACLRVLVSLKKNYGDASWGRYGFCDALHPQAGWYDPDVLGIDLGNWVGHGGKSAFRACLEDVCSQSGDGCRDEESRLSWLEACKVCTNPGAYVSG